MRCVVVPSSLFIRKSGPHVHQEMDPGVCGVEQERWFSCSCSQGETNSGLQAPSLWPGLLRGFSSHAWIWSVTPFFLSHPFRGQHREPCTVSVSWLALGNGSILEAHCCGGCMASRASFHAWEGPERGAQERRRTALEQVQFIQQPLSGLWFSALFQLCSAHSCLGEFIHSVALWHFDAYKWQP